MLALVMLTPATGFAQSTPEATARPQVRTVVAGSHYAEPPGGQEWLLGSGYRDLWTEPFEVEILDLRAFGDGLTPVMRVGGMQTLGLAMRGGDGRDYTFRSVDKVYSPETIPPSFRGTFIEDVIQDQIAANVPGVQVVAGPIERAAGVMGLPDARLFVMPDAPELGEFRDDFAGVLGVITEYPQAVSDDNPGFRGALEILDPDEFWGRRRAGPSDLPDSRAFLRARLLDLLFNDWDRHHGQWRWARMPGEARLQPIPEDRDQLFTDFGGVLLDLARTQGAQFVKFGESPEPLRRIVKNGWDVDRYILVDVTRDDWLGIAGDVRGRLTDAVIEEGLSRMPPEYLALRGEELGRKLRSRRDQLVDIAADYYAYLSDKVDIHATDANESVRIESVEGGGVRVRIALDSSAASDESPYFDRTFAASETSEVRIYLHGGADRVRTVGQKPGLTIRVVSDLGSVVVDESRGFGVRLYSSGGDHAVVGGDRSRVDARPYAAPTPEPPNDTPGVPAQDWGGLTKPLAIGGYQSDPGLILGVGVDAVRHGFRRYPWGSRHLLKGAFAFGVRRGFVDYRGSRRGEASGLGWSIHARFSGVDQFRYYGRGNETESAGPDDRYRISSTQLTVFPAMVWFGDRGRLDFGPVLRYADSSGEPGGVLDDERPLGTGRFGQLGGRLVGRFDSRAAQSVLEPGFLLEGEGAIYPGVWDVQQSFGYLDAHVGAWMRVLDPLMLSLHVRGRSVWGDAPFFEAAYVGGQRYPLGTKWNRWAGDRSLGGLASLRWTLTRFRGLVPGTLGLFGMGNAGRVFVTDEDSGSWHPSSAGGVFLTSFDRSSALHIGAGSSPDEGFFWLIMASFAALPLQ